MKHKAWIKAGSKKKTQINKSLDIFSGLYFTTKQKKYWVKKNAPLINSSLLLIVLR
jgi:hypothetical protein